MYPEAFINWIGDNGYFRVREIWYVWPEEEKQDFPIAANTEELFKVWEEQIAQPPTTATNINCEHDWSAWKELTTGTWRRCWKCSEWDLKPA